MVDQQCSIYIAENQFGVSAGVVRFEDRDDQVFVSVALEPRFRGCGLGGHLIRLGSQRYRQECGEKTLVALVKKSNVPSRRAFEIAGYRRMPLKNPDMFRYEL